MDKKEFTAAVDAQEIPYIEQSPTENTKVSMELKDMISSVVIALFGLYVMISGIHMSIVSQQMSGTAWYGTPGILPIVIGSVLCFLSIIMFISSYRSGARINKALLDSAITYLKTQAFMRLVVAIGLLALYIFVLFRLLPFLVSTFIYLAANMIFFREKDYPVWKIIIICAAFTVAIFLFFGKVAGVPLP